MNLSDMDWIDKTNPTRLKADIKKSLVAFMRFHLKLSSTTSQVKLKNKIKIRTLILILVIQNFILIKIIIFDIL